jgi:hypothetical protein
MKVPTYQTVFKKVIREEKLNPIEDFIVKHGPVIGDEKGQKKFIRDLQKVVDYVEDETACDFF